MTARTPTARTSTLIAALLCGLVSLGALPGRALGQEPVTVGIPGNAPFTGLSDGKVTGIIAEATVQVLEAMGHRVTPERIPFARIYKWVHSGKLDVGTSMLRTEARAAQAHYTGPVVTEYTLIAVPKGKAFPLRTVGDLKGRKIGGMLGFKYPSLDAQGIPLVRERSYELNLRKAARGRLDGILIGSITGPFLVERLGLSDKIEFLPVAINPVPLGAALSMKRFDKKDLRAFEEALAALKAGPEWRQILENNGVNDYIRTWPVLDN